MEGSWPERGYVYCRQQEWKGGTPKPFRPQCFHRKPPKWTKNCRAWCFPDGVWSSNEMIILVFGMRIFTLSHHMLNICNFFLFHRSTQLRDYLEFHIRLGFLAF